MEEMTHKELLSLYGWSVSELAEFRGRQWSVTNAVLLIDAALVAVTHYLPPAGAYRQGAVVMLCVGVLVLLAFGVNVVVCALGKALTLRAQRMDRLRNRLSPEFMEAWGEKLPAKTDQTPGIFRFVLCGGGVLALVVIASRWQ